MCDNLMNLDYAEILTVSNLREMLDLTWDYRTRWRLIGSQLGIDSGTLDAVNTNNHTVEECLSDMLKQWLNSDSCTLSAINKALQSPHVVNAILAQNGILACSCKHFVSVSWSWNFKIHGWYPEEVGYDF